jgi:hypothetical protein
MSDTPTPRTDAAEEQSIRAYEKEREAGWPSFPCDGYDFARELERELAAVTKERDIEIERAWHYRDKWQDALARIKRLEEAGDAMAEYIASGPDVQKWTQAKEAR